MPLRAKAAIQRGNIGKAEIPQLAQKNRKTQTAKIQKNVSATNLLGAIQPAKKATHSVSTTSLREEVSDVVNKVIYTRERFTVTRHGRWVAAIVPHEDLELLELLEDLMDLDAARKALESVAKNGTTAWEKIRSRLKL